MKCDICGRNEANVLYRQNINGNQQTYNLCTHCLAEIRKSRGLNFGSDLLDGKFQDNFANMPFGLMSRLGRMTHSFDDNFFNGIFNFLSDGDMTTFDLSPFMRFDSFLPTISEHEQKDLALHDRADGYKTENNSEDKGLKYFEEEEAKLIERLARLSYDKDKGFRLELEENDEPRKKDNQEQNKKLKLLTKEELASLIKTLQVDKARELLEGQKKLAIELEDYERAAELRDLLKKLNSEE